MAEDIVGQVVVQILGEASLKQIKAEVKKAVEAAGPIVVPVELKLAPKAVTGFVAETKKQLKAVKHKPSLAANLHLNKNAVNVLVADTRKRFADRVDIPRLPTGLKLADKSVAGVIADANAKIAAAKGRKPKIKVDLDLDTEQMELVRELRTRVTAMNVAFTGELQIPIDLDEDSIRRVSEKAALAMARIQAEIDAQTLRRDEISQLRLDDLRDKDLVKHEAYLRDRDNMLADAARKDFDRQQNRTKNMAGILDEDLGKIQNRLNEATSRGLDARSMAELRFQQRRILLNEKAEQSIRKSSGSSLRILRNDLSSFDAFGTRLVRRLGLVFAGFTAGVVASFAAIGIASLRSFAETETQIRRTAAVLGTDIFSETIASTNDQTKAFAAFRAEVERTDKALRSTVENVALSTVFDPTEVAAGTRALAQAGLKVDEIKASLLATAQFAQNEEMLPEEAVANLVQGATAAGESLSELTLLADQFTFVANNTTATATEVAAAFSNRAAPAFRAYGEEVSATLTVLDLFAAAGIRGKTAGEQAGILIREINKAATKTPATTAAFKKYGIEIGKVNGVQVPFLKTLADLGVKLEEVRKARGSGGLAAFRKELGLTEKSGAGLLQLLPQISKLGEEGMLNLQKQIERSGGAVARQAEIITDTLGFQFEQFTNQIGALFKIAAGPTGRALTDVLAKFNDQLESGSASGDRLKTKFLEIGQAISDEIVPAIQAFFFDGQGADFFGGIVQMYRGFLGGLRDAFVEFRVAAFGEGDKRGFFTVLGQALGNLGDFAAASLPRIGNALGVVTRFIRENESLVRTFLRFTLTMFVANKALRLFIVPATNLYETFKKLYKATLAFLGLNVVQSVVGQAQAMMTLTTATTAQTVATNALATAQARQASTSIATRGAMASGLGGLLDTRLFRNLDRLSGLGKIAKSATLVTAALTLAVPAVIGFADGLSKSTGEADSLSVATGILSENLSKLRDNLGVLGRPMEESRNAGNKLGQSFRAASNSVLDFGVSWAAIGFGDMEASSEAASRSMDNAGLALLRFGDLLIPDGIEEHNIEMLRFKENADAIERSLAGEPGLVTAMEDLNIKLMATTRIMRGQVFANLAAEQERYTQSVSGALRFAPRQIAVAGRLTALQRALGLSLFQVAVRGREANAAYTPLQARMANVAYETGVLTGKIKDNAAWTQIASHASRLYNVNLIRLYRGQRNLESQLEEVAAGNERAASNYVNNVRLAGLETQAAKRLELQLARTAVRRIQAATAAGMASSMLIAAQVRFEKAERNNARAAALTNRAVNEANELVKELQESFNDTTGAGGATAATAAAVEQVKTAAEQATEAVNKLTQAQLNRQAAVLVGKVMRNTAGGYKATAMQAEILKRVLPGVEAQLQRQQAAVAKLDTALQALQSTQLKGTKAFSDQSFAIEQSVKGLQLQRLDLVIAGTPEEDAAIKALDAQIASLQQQSERLSLVESLQLDPLKRKLEETFTPVKELGFDEIIKQFKAIQAEKAPLTEAIAGGENLKAALEATIADAEARFGEAGKQVTIGFANGIKATTPQVTAAGKASGQAALAGVNQVMAFGSPSRTMIQRGEWVSQGFVVGINSGNAAVQQAGVTSMWSFLTGMRNVYENRVKPFVISIAEWIKENKGPVAYDATLLRPAGEAMMYGFKRGLTDGFGEIQSWVRDVGPQLANDTFPKDMFFKRSASFLINNARMDKDFNADDAFGDMVFDALGLIGGDVPQSLAFLHKTLSSADTLDMAQKLAKMFGTPISDFLRPPGTLTKSGNVSDHTKGTAVDFSNGTRPTPQMDALHAAIEPLLGKVFSQILYRTMIGGNHFNHVHAAWMKGDGFSMNSGKKGGLSFPGASDIVNAAMAEASSKTGVNPMLIAAIAKAESGFDPRAGSPAGAQGLMQLMPATARGLGVTNVFDPFQNALGGSKYIKGLLEKYGSIRLALAGYNAGPGNVAKYNGVPPFSETMAYIERVMRYFKNFSTGNFRAQGGKVNALTPYVVGERGQEMFIPSTNGSVVSNRDLRGLISALQNQPAGNSGSTVYDQRQNHIYSNSNDPATIAALVDSRMRSQIVGVRR